jgi:phosphoenolpyruvate-protein kinase (PTS system EI component)
LKVAIQRLENEIENLKDKLRRNFFTSSEAISNTHERLLENLSLDTQMVENVVKAQGFTLERLASDNKILTETIFEIFSELIKTFNLEDSNLEPEVINFIMICRIGNLI